MPSDLVTVSLASALVCAAATTALAIIARAAITLWRRLRKTQFAGALMHRPGQAYAHCARQSAWRVRLALADVVAASAGAASAAVLANPTLTLAGWQRLGIAASAVFIALLIVGMFILHGLRSANWRRHARSRELVAQHLHRIGGERDRVFHDVVTADGRWVDHVLLGVQGAFGVLVVATPTGKTGVAERHGDRLLLDDSGRYVDLAEVRQRVNRLQHALSKQLGRMIRVRAVVALPGWRILNNNGDDVLIVGHSDIVMIKGWRSASDGLMNEDADTLQNQLEAMTRGTLRPSAAVLQAHEPVVTPPRNNAAGARGRKATVTA